MYKRTEGPKRALSALLSQYNEIHQPMACHAVQTDRQTSRHKPDRCFTLTAIDPAMQRNEVEMLKSLKNIALQATLARSVVTTIVTSPPRLGCEVL